MAESIIRKRTVVYILVFLGFKQKVQTESKDNTRERLQDSKSSVMFMIPGIIPMRSMGKVIWKYTVVP